MATFRYLVCRTTDGLILDELPLATTSLPRLIGADSTTSFHLPLGDPRVGPAWAGLTDPRRVPMVVALRDEAPAWAGLINTRRGVSILELGAVTLEGWLARRMYPPPGVTVNHEDDDQFVIARKIVDTAAGAGALGDSLGMDIDTAQTPTASGVNRDRHYTPDDPADALTRLTQLGEVIRGFEWTIELDYVPGDTNVSPRLVLAYPQMGRRATEPEWRFEVGVGGAGGNIVDYDDAADASVGKFATEVVSTGAGEGEAKVISAPARDEAWEAEIGLRIQQVTTYSTVKRQDTIDEHAEADLEVLRHGEEIITVRVRADMDPSFGQYRLGDDCRLVIEDTPRHPRKADGSPGLDILTRIVGWSLDPATDQVDLDFDFHPDQVS